MPGPDPQFENAKFAHLRPQYREALSEILSLGFEPEDYIHHFPSFIGHLTLARYLSLYEAYKLAQPVAGHIAEVGMYLGAGSLLFAKLAQLFEPHSLTLVHGFDWFKGAVTTGAERYVKAGECKADEATVRRLIEAQGLGNIVHVHNIDVSTQLSAFFERNSHLQFKLVFLDIGIYDVVAESLRQFWPRMTPGAVLVLDHFSHEFAPGEMRAVRELLPDVEFRQFPFGWMPAAYAVKR